MNRNLPGPGLTPGFRWIGGYATNRSPPAGLVACPNTASVASNSATLSAFADVNCLHNSAALAGVGRPARAVRTHLGLLGEGLLPGKFFWLLGCIGGRPHLTAFHSAFNIQHSSFSISSPAALAGGLACPELVERACRVLEFGAEPADQAVLFFAGPFDVAQGRSAIIAAVAGHFASPRPADGAQPQHRTAGERHDTKAARAIVRR